MFEWFEIMIIERIARVFLVEQNVDEILCVFSDNAIRNYTRE